MTATCTHLDTWGRGNQFWTAKSGGERGGVQKGPS